MHAHAIPMNVPKVYGVDQSPTKSNDYGKCTKEVEARIQHTSHWCKFGKLGSFPEYPNYAARKALKFGRQTVFRGPILKQKFACNVDGIGSNTHATVAVSTKYINSRQGGWDKDKGACGKCLCIHVLGADNLYSPGVQKHVVLKYKGLSFMGKVGDRCAECATDSIDVLLDRPYAYSPTNDPTGNAKAGIVNRLNGTRAFTALKGAETPESVGTWTAMWQFVPCSWSHKQCASFMSSHGYRSWTPMWTKGIN
jgi:hypothetical protein